MTSAAGVDRADLAAHAAAVGDLASAHRSLALLRATRFECWARTWIASEGLGVTERDRRATADCAMLDAEISRAQGEVAALQVELAHVALVVQVALGHADPAC